MSPIRILLLSLALASLPSYGASFKERLAARCGKYLGQAKLAVAAHRNADSPKSKADLVIESLGGLSSLWSQGDGLRFDGGDGSHISPLEQKEIDQTVALLDEAMIEADLSLTPLLSREARFEQIRILTRAYETVYFRPKLRGFTFEQRVKLRILSATLLKEMDLLPPDFAFDPLKNPNGIKFSVSNFTAYDVYLELQGMLDNRYLRTDNRWGWWERSQRIDASESRGPLKMLYGDNSSREIFWLLNSTRYWGPENMNLSKMRFVRNFVGDKMVSIEVLLRLSDGSWKPMMFEVDGGNALSPVSRIKGQTVSQFCMGCHSGLNQGKALPHFIRNREELLKEIKPMQFEKNPNHFFEENIRYLLEN